MFTCFPATKRSYGSFEEMEKGTSAIHGATVFFYQKGHGAAPFYVSLDKTIRPRETTLRQDRHITLIHLRNCFVTAVDTARNTPGIRNNIISDQTVRNRLRQSGLRSRRPLKGMELKLRHRIARLQWALARLRWRRNTWQNIMFSDESKFNSNLATEDCVFIVVVGNVSLMVV